VGVGGREGGVGQLERGRGRGGWKGEVEGGSWKG